MVERWMVKWFREAELEQQRALELRALLIKLSHYSLLYE
jgi:hypothetical protein